MRKSKIIMSQDSTSTFADRVEKLADPTVRDALRLTAKPSIIPLAGGLPNAKLFPKDTIIEAIDAIEVKSLDTALQYSSTSGITELRTAIARYLSEKWDKKINLENILITTGSQQALDLIGRTFIDAKNTVAVANPTYLAAIGAFNAYDPIYTTFDLENDGPQTEQLQDIMESKNKPKFIYTVPTFQNPSGITWSLEKRELTLSLAKENNVLIIEDDPYGELYFDTPPPAAITAMDDSNNTIYLGTFSKTLVPGLRIGYMVAEESLIEKFVLIKQSMDLHSSTLSQLIISYLLNKPGFYENHLAKLRTYYAAQSKHMMQLLDKYLTGKATWTIPDGGLFTWVTIPGANSKELLIRAVENNVAFMPGYAFYANEADMSTIRLTFATASKEMMKDGVRSLADTIHL